MKAWWNQVRTKIIEYWLRWRSRRWVLVPLLLVVILIGLIFPRPGYVAHLTDELVAMEGVPQGVLPVNETIATPTPFLPLLAADIAPIPVTAITPVSPPVAAMTEPMSPTLVAQLPTVAAAAPLTVALAISTPVSVSTQVQVSAPLSVTVPVTDSQVAANTVTTSTIGAGEMVSTWQRGRMLALPLLFVADPKAAPPVVKLTQQVLKPEDWRTWPLIPTVSEKARAIYQDGIAKGNNPQHFSVVGDCQSMPNLYMGAFDQGNYQLPDGFDYLKETVANFSGSFKRYSPTVIDAANAATMLWQGWASVQSCGANEVPLDCELRIHKPVIVMINLGTHSSARNGVYLRQIVQTIINHGAVPLIETKGDNLEHNYSINLDLARVASENDIPLWNFWSSIQEMPNGGLDPVRQGGNMYLVPDALQRRRFYALWALDTVWRAVK